MRNRAGAVILAVLGAFLSAAACGSPDEAEAQGPKVPSGPGLGEPGEEPAKRYAISIAQPDNGVIACSRTSAAAGTAVTLTLTARDEDYRYLAGSLSIEPDLELTDRGGGVWAFTMPEENVSITAEFEEIPVHAVAFSGGDENGSFSVEGVAATGEAREGALITITAMPHAGYKLADDGLRVTPEGAVAFARAEGQSAWTFTMADTDLEISVAFAELGLLEIYQGGARRGISIGALSDDLKYYASSIDMESEEPGHNGNQRAIKITPALNANGNGAQQSFGLFSDAAIDLETVCALSFWARANKTLNIRYVGFGGADPDQRVVYTGEKYNQQIPVGVEWKRYVVPVPAPRNGQRADRVFLFNAALAVGNYVCIDDIEFVQTGVTLAAITIADANDGLFYGAADAARILKGVPLKLVYACDDGAVVTLQNASNSHTLKYNLAPWLLPFIEGSGSGAFTAHIDGVSSNPMSAQIIDGLLLDDFEDIAGAGSVSIPADPVEGKGYLWHASGSGSVVVSRGYITDAHNEIHRGLRAGSWRPTATAANPRGGRNFDAKDASIYHTLSFWIKVTVGGGNTALQQNTVFTFELRNGGALNNKPNGAFFKQQFTYNTDNPDGWQQVAMPLAAFVNLGLDTSAVTGYAFGVVDNRGSALRIMLDDIALTP